MTRISIQVHVNQVQDSYSNAFFIIRELSIMCELLFPVAGAAALCLPMYLQANQYKIHLHAKSIQSKLIHIVI